MAATSGVRAPSPRASEETGQPWQSLFLSESSPSAQPFTFMLPPEQLLAPLDPRTQDPNIAPWNDISHEDNDPLPPLSSPGVRRQFPSKPSSFSLSHGSLFSGRGRTSESAQSDLASIGTESKKSSASGFFNQLRKKSSAKKISKESSVNFPVPPVPAFPNGRGPPSPPVRKFRKSSKNKAPPPVPPKDHDDLFLDTNLESLEGIVDSSRLAPDARGSLTSNDTATPATFVRHDSAPWDDRPAPSAGVLMSDPVTHPWTDPAALSTRGAAAPFTNPFAGQSSAPLVSSKKRKPEPLKLFSASPVSIQARNIPPTNGGPKQVDPKDHRRQSWVAPESWAVERDGAQNDGYTTDEVEEGDESEGGILESPPPRKGSLASVGVPAKGTRTRPERKFDEDEGGGVSIHPLEPIKQIGPGGEYRIRVFYGDDGTHHILRISYSETAQELVTTKFQPKGRMEGDYRLWIRERGRDRILAPSERLVPLLRKRLELAGYDDDQLQAVGAEDLSHIFKLVIRDASWRAESEEVTQIQNPAFIDLTSMGLSKIPIILHKLAPQIVLLNLSRNVGIDLPLDFIQSCETLRELKLSAVGLKRVPAAIRHSTGLVRLDISSNRIADLDEAGLDSIPGLRSIKLQSNRLTNLPNYFARMNQINDLNVSNNRFDGFPGVLFSMTTLYDLDISYNNISVFPPAIGNLVNLQRLTIIGNKLASFPPQCAQLVNLEVLDCRRNFITDISLVSCLPKLKRLLAQNNAVHLLDVALGPCLSFLEIAHNQITRVKLLPLPSEDPTANPAAPGLGNALLTLDLSHTKLSSLDGDVIAQLTGLGTLKLDYNHFRRLPREVCSLVHLQVLSCSNNDMDELPDEIGNLENLQILDIHSNSVHTIPSSIWLCKNLHTFNATSNLIEIWRNPLPIQKDSGTIAASPGPFGSHPDITASASETDRRPSHARALNGVGSNTGNGTPIGTVSSRPPQRHQYPLEGSLQRLFLSDNLLKDDAIIVLSRLTQLRVLNLSFNDIQDLPSQWLKRFPLLEELYLSGNKLSALQADGLQALTKLNTLYLNGNKLQSLPSALNKIAALTVLDVGSNLLRYNINNWHFDWNWNFNRNLKYLNLSGNTRLEIRPEPNKRHHLDRSDGPVLHEFNALSMLKTLGLMDVTTSWMSAIPDDNEDRRVRTSGSDINGMGYGIADTIGKNNQLAMYDIVVPSFRMKDNECLFGMFGRPEPSHSSLRISKFVQDRFTNELIMKLNQLRPELDEGVTQALRRAFMSMNRELSKFLHNSAYGYGQFTRKLSHGSTSTNGSGLAPGSDISILKAGSSAVVIYIVDKTMYVANVGNALAVVSRHGEAKLVSVKHDPLDKDELARIRAAEGWVSPKGLLSDELNVSRAFGMYHLFPSIIARPAVVDWEITDQDEFVIIGNCMLWDFVPYQNAVDIARQCRDPMAAAQKLRDMAISYGADGSVMIMVLSVSDLFPAKATQRRNAEETGEFGGFRNPRANNEPISSKALNRLPDEVDAPIGSVALVFTDIRNSTHLWEKNAGMRTAMTMHNDLLKRLLLTIGGYLVKTEGDAFMCSFPTVASALLWCLTVQIALTKLEWPLEILESQDGREIYDSEGTLVARGLSVRMGIHWGSPLCEPDFITHRMDYLGPVVNRASRISGSAKGGQIMVSNDVIKELSQHFSLDDATPPPAPPKGGTDDNSEERIRERGHIESLRRMGFIITYVGEQKLKGIEAPEALSLVWPKELEGRKEIQEMPETEVSAAAADASSRVPFSIAQMKELAMLCIRLETLTSNRVFRATPDTRKGSAASANPSGVLNTANLVHTAIVIEETGVSGTPKTSNSIDILPAVTGTILAEVEQQEETADTEDSVYLMANPELLMPTIKEGATDEYLMLLLDSLSLRINNALASLYLKQLGGYKPMQ